MPPDRTASKSAEPAVPSERPLSLSCTTCRARKVKCDSGRPCSNCANSGSPETCAYKPRQKPGLKAGLSNDLLERFAALEQRMLQIGESGGGGGGSGDTVTRVSELEQNLAQLSHRIVELERRGSAFALSASASTPSSMATTTSFHPPTFGYPHDAAHSPGLPVPPPGTTAVYTSATQAPPNFDIPPPELLQTLIDLFFVNVAPYAPILQRQDLHPTELPDGSLKWPLPVYGVVVATLRFSFDPRWSSLLPKEHYRERARSRVLLHSCSTTSLASLQALALVALDDLVGSSTPKGWGSLALLTRTASHMLLAQEEANAHQASASVSPMRLLGTPSSFAEEEGRRRLFWIIFLLDRFSASATGWDFAFLDQQISRKLPAPESVWTPAMEPTPAPLFRSPYLHPSVFASPSYDASSLDVGFSALIEIFDLLGHVHQLHRSKLEDVQLFVQETDSLEGRLQRWYRALPHEVTTESTDSNHVLVQAMYWATVIKLLSLVAYPLFRNLSPNLLAVENAHSASVAIASLTKIIPIRSPYFAWACFVAARMLVLRAHRRHEPIDPAIHQLGQAFKDASASCDLARRYLTLISRALQRLHSLDGTLGGAAALVDLHHTSFSAESAVLPSGAVTPVGGSYQPAADLARLAEAGAPYWATTATAPDGAGEAGASAVTGAEAGGGGGGEGLDMWLDSDLLGHSFEGWFDLPVFTSPTATGEAAMQQ